MASDLPPFLMLSSGVPDSAFVDFSDDLLIVKEEDTKSCYLANDAPCHVPPWVSLNPSCATRMPWLFRLPFLKVSSNSMICSWEFLPLMLLITLVIIDFSTFHPEIP